MVLYDAMVLVSARAPRSACADVLRRLGGSVQSAGGVVTDVTSYGARTLAYEFRRPGERHFEVRRPGGGGGTRAGGVGRSRVGTGARADGWIDDGVRVAAVVMCAGAVREDVVQRAAESGGGGGARVARRRAGVAVDVHEEARGEAVERF